MPPSTMASYTIYGLTIKPDFEPKVIFVMPVSTTESRTALSIKINGKWMTIYCSETLDSQGYMSDEYTVTENADGTYTVPAVLTAANETYKVRCFVFA